MNIEDKFRFSFKTNLSIMHSILYFEGTGRPLLTFKNLFFYISLGRPVIYWLQDVREIDIYQF